MPIQRILVLLALGCLPATISASDDSPAQTTLSEWQVRNVWRVELEGNEAFSPDNIRRALAMNPATQATVSETIPRAEFVTTVVKQIQAGYRNEGFRQATVTAMYDEKRQVVQATIVEGPRYELEALPTIEGIGQPIQAELIAALTKARPAPTPENPYATDAAVWKAGPRQVPDDGDLDKIREAIAACLARHGYHFADYEVTLEINDGQQSIGLNVAINDPGQPLQWKGIEVTGLSRHSLQQVTDFLQIPPDAVASDELHAQITKQLLDSGRFLIAHSWHEIPFGPEEPVTIQITLREFEDVPLLTEPLTQRQQQLLKCAAWLNRWHEQDDDIRVTLTADLESLRESDAPAADSGGQAATATVSSNASIQSFLDALAIRYVRGDVVFSGAAGTLAAVDVRNTADESILDLTVNHTIDGVRVVSGRRQSVWHRNEPTGVPYATISVLGVPLNDESESDQKARMGLWFGFNSEPRNSPLIQFNITPAAWLSSFRTGKAEFEESMIPGALRVRVGEAFLEFDRDSGMLHTAEMVSGPNRIRIQREPDAMQREIARLESVTATWPNQCRTDRPLSSLVAFVASEGESLCRLAGIDAAPLLLRVLQQPDTVGASVDRAMSLFSEDWFSIPNDGKQLSSANWQLHLAMATLPPGCTAHRLSAAMVGIQMTGDPRSLLFLLQEIENDDTHGPIDCLAAAFLVPQTRSRLAQLGLERLTGERALRDLQPLISERSVPSDLLHGSIRLVRSLTDEEVQLLAETIAVVVSEPDNADSAAARRHATMLMALIRNHPSDEPDVIASGLMPLIWHAGMEDAVRAQLTAFRDEGKPPSVFRTVGESQKVAGPGNGPSATGKHSRNNEASKRGSNDVPAVDIPDPSEAVFKPKLEVLSGKGREK